MHNRFEWRWGDYSQLPGQRHRPNILRNRFFHHYIRDDHVSGWRCLPGAVSIHLSFISPNSLLLTALGYSPWRTFARVVFQNSVLPNLIDPIGYTTLAANATPIFSEFDNTDAGASTAKRVTYTPISAAITHAQVLGASYDSWIDNTF
jgi:hypothetical protein